MLDRRRIVGDKADRGQNSSKAEYEFYVDKVG